MRRFSTFCLTTTSGLYNDSISIKNIDDKDSLMFISTCCSGEHTLAQTEAFCTFKLKNAQYTSNFEIISPTKSIGRVSPPTNDSRMASDPSNASCSVFLFSELSSVLVDRDVVPCNVFYST